MVAWWIVALGSAAFQTVASIFRKRGTKREHALEFELTRTTITALFCLFLIPFLTFKYTTASVLITYFISVLGAAGILLTAKRSTTRNGRVRY